MIKSGGIKRFFEVVIFALMPLWFPVAFICSPFIFLVVMAVLYIKNGD